MISVNKRSLVDGFFVFKGEGAGRTVGAEGCARDLGELLTRLHVLDHRLVEAGQVRVPFLHAATPTEVSRSVPAARVPSHLEPYRQRSRCGRMTKAKKSGRRQRALDRGSCRARGNRAKDLGSELAI